MQVNPDCQFDSFVTMGLEGPALVVGALSTVGIDFDSWTETQGLTTTNGAPHTVPAARPSFSKPFAPPSGAVFFMDPEHGAETDGTNTVVVLQLTVPTGTSFTGSISAQGRAQGEMPDWEENSMTFSSDVGSKSAGGSVDKMGAGH